MTPANLLLRLCPQLPCPSNPRHYSRISILQVVFNFLRQFIKIFKLSQMINDRVVVSVLNVFELRIVIIRPFVDLDRLQIA